MTINIFHYSKVLNFFSLDDMANEWKKSTAMNRKCKGSYLSGVEKISFLLKEYSINIYSSNKVFVDIPKTFFLIFRLISILHIYVCSVCVCV